MLGLYLGIVKSKGDVSVPEERKKKHVTPPYWQIKRNNPFFIFLIPLPYHKIMKIPIPLLSEILNCARNATLGLKEINAQPSSPVRVAQVLFVLNSFQSFVIPPLRAVLPCSE